MQGLSFLRSMDCEEAARILLFKCCLCHGSCCCLRIVKDLRVVGIRKERTGNMDRKVILIAPVYPYKDVISHHTGLMYRELVKRYDVEMISYKCSIPNDRFARNRRIIFSVSGYISSTRYLISSAQSTAVRCSRADT